MNALALLLAPALALGAAPASPNDDSPKLRRAGTAQISSGVDQAALEAYLKTRLARVREDHKARLEFLDKQKKLAAAFFDQIRDERNVFEVRMARQRLDLFESLGSLKPKDHPQAVSDFEKLQSNVTRAFENDLKQRMAKFFSEREALWRSFAVNQEKAREGFASEGEAAWQTQKSLVIKAAEGAKKE